MAQLLCHKTSFSNKEPKAALTHVWLWPQSSWGHKSEGLMHLLPVWSRTWSRLRGLHCWHQHSICGSTSPKLSYTDSFGEDQVTTQRNGSPLTTKDSDASTWAATATSSIKGRCHYAILSSL